jgi:hypothetical protein
LATIQGAAWDCPHCGERILRSAAACPACRRYLRFEAVGGARAAGAIVCPLSIDGQIHHPGNQDAWEYSVLIEVRDERGEVMARRVIGVGALRPGGSRQFTLRVEVRVPEEAPVAAVRSDRSSR